MVSLEMAPVTDAGLLPTCIPYLMPFHISYNGPAPVSRYFRPRPAPPSLPALFVRSSDTVTPVASSSSTSILSETKSSLTVVSSTTSIESLAHENECRGGALPSMTGPSSGVINRAEQLTATELATDIAMYSDTQPALDAVPHNNSSMLTSAHIPASRNENVKRFVAAFRGRQMYGQAVDIPSGYGGLVLRAPLSSSEKGKEDATEAKSRSKTRGGTRRLKSTTADEPEGDWCLDPDIDPPLPTKKLVPVSTFTSFMLWTPDRPLDEGSDEYARTLVEWTRLATEIHSYDE